MDTTFCFIRHGEVENPENIVYGHRPFPLSPNGEAQIRELADVLKNRGMLPDVIYASDLVRATQSARIFSELFGGIPTVIKEELRETYTDDGYTGKPLTWALSIDDPYKDPKGYTIESPQHIIQRQMNVIKEIQRNHQGRIIYVVGHGDPLIFLVWRLFYPDQPVPSIMALRKEYKLAKGECWKVILNQQGQVVADERIRTKTTSTMPASQRD